MKTRGFLHTPDLCLWTIVAVTAIAICRLPIAKAMECPPDNSGCRCAHSVDEIECSGPLTQTDITNFIASYRLQNNLTHNETLELSSFTLSNSTLTTFDLTPLLWTKVEMLVVGSNPNLTLIMANGTNSGGLIEAKVVSFPFNALSDGLSEALQLFNSSQVRQLNLEFNNLREVPNLSTFRNLEHLNLRSNKISDVKGGWFRNLSALYELKLESNPVEVVSESAFLIDPPPPDHSTAKLELSIYLDFNNLTSEKFSPESGIDKLKRLVILSLSDHFDSLPQNVFQPIFEADVGHKVLLQRNKALVCDSKLKWLVDRRDEFEGKVVGPWCSNDPDETLWTSTKVNSSWAVKGPGISMLVLLSCISMFISM